MAADTGTRETAAAPVRGPAIAAAVAFVLAALSALATPLMGLPDEPAHAVHAVGVVHGEVAGDDAVRTDPASGWTRTETTVEVPAAYAALPALPTCFAFRPAVPADCAPEVSGTAGPVMPATTTVGTYAPAWYAAIGWPSLLLPPAVALYGMRLVVAGLFAAMVAVAVLAVLRAGAGAWGLVGVALALPPVAVHLAGGINPSGTEIAAGVALWATSAAVVSGADTRADLVRWAAAGVVVAVTRPLGPLLAVGIPVATVLVLRPGSPPPSRPGRLRGAAVVVGVAAVAAGGWSVWRGTLSAFSGFPAPESTGLAAVRRSLSLVPERLAEMVGVLGWADVTLPSVLVVGWLAATGAIVVVALAGADRRARWWMLGLAAVVLLLPVVADVRSAPSIGFVWQGRYTLPVAAGLPVLAGVLLARSRPARLVRSRGVPAAALGLLGAGHVVALVAVLQRFRVGAGGGVLSALGGPVGAEILPGWLLVTAAAIVAAIPAVTLRKGHGALRGEVSGRR